MIKDIGPVKAADPLPELRGVLRSQVNPAPASMVDLLARYATNRWHR
jgi:hypothetical protein